MRIESESDTHRLGDAIGTAAAPGDLIYLDGDLGAGKTTITKSIAAALGISPDTVTSPTFSLLHEYTEGRIPLYHLDIYRLRNGSELTNLAFSDYVNAGDGLIVIEWATNATGELPEDALSILITVVNTESGQRDAALRANGPDSERLLTRIENLLS